MSRPKTSKSRISLSSIYNSPSRVFVDGSVKPDGRNINLCDASMFTLDATQTPAHSPPPAFRSPRLYSSTATATATVDPGLALPPHEPHKPNPMPESDSDERACA
jgi:hypothetical protein